STARQTAENPRPTAAPAPDRKTARHGGAEDLLVFGSARQVVARSTRLARTTPARARTQFPIPSAPPRLPVLPKSGWSPSRGNVGGRRFRRSGRCGGRRAARA